MFKIFTLFSIFIIGANSEQFVIDPDMIKQFFSPAPATGSPSTGGTSSGSSGGGSSPAATPAVAPAPPGAPTPPTDTLCKNAMPTPCPAATTGVCKLKTEAPCNTGVQATIDADALCINHTTKPLPTACCLPASAAECQPLASPAPTTAAGGTPSTAGVSFTPLSGSVSG